MKTLKIYSDGSCLGNPGAGGYCAILKYGGHEKVISAGQKDTTNNIMELTGAIVALEALTEPCKVLLHSDSKYVLDGLNSWLPNWVKNNWKTAAKKPVKNVELWQRMYAMTLKHAIEIIWIKGHSGHPENEKCDTIARKEAEAIKKVS